MEKPADIQHPIHELLRRRWSPQAFSERPVEPETLAGLLEAARWAPSSYNEQPWFFLLARKEEPEEFRRMLGCLVDGNILWAKNAPALMISVAKLRFEKSGQPNRHAFHDVGQAAANLTIEGMARGLFVHQMAGIHAEKIREEYAIPENYEPVAALALGYPGDPAALPDALREREVSPRARKPLESFVFAGRWGQTARIIQYAI